MIQTGNSELQNESQKDRNLSNEVQYVLQRHRYLFGGRLSCLSQQAINFQMFQSHL